MNSSLEHWLWIQPKVTNRLKAGKLSYISQNSLNHSSSSTERVKLYLLHNANTFKAVYHHSFCHRIFHSHVVTWTAASGTDSGYNQRYQTDSKQQNCRIFLRTHWIILARELKEWSCISSTIQIPSKQYIIIHYVIEYSTHMQLHEQQPRALTLDTTKGNKPTQSSKTVVYFSELTESFELENWKSEAVFPPQFKYLQSSISSFILS
jgi:hypothetical protein